ncbi:MAG: acyl-CoA thioesterase [Melioribacteraceae bacterium]|nr:MAG: acyl-CoA thioesterase [Melioribacteraceae bacterium]
MFKQKIRINFYDCDPAGILFYANLFKFAHKTYEALIESFEMKAGYFDNENFVVPIIHTEGNYFIPMNPGDKIEVSVYVSQIRNSSFELTYNFTNHDSNTCAQVKTVHVFVDKISFKKINVPEEILKNLEANRR